MPLISRLDFVQHGGLRVAYRASPSPQELTIDVMTAGVPHKGAANWYFQALIDDINAGAAGGALFAPSQGLAELLSGPDHDADALRPDHHAVLRVSGVSPLFLRTIVEELRWAGVEHPTTHLSIVGSEPLDQSALSVREHHVRAWLDDPSAYLEPWPSPGLKIQMNDLRSGAALRVVTASPITPPVREELEQLSVRWLNAVRNYVSDEGAEPKTNLGKMLPAYGQGKSEFRARYGQFLYAREPSRAIIANMLVRFHERVAPLVEAEVSL